MSRIFSDGECESIAKLILAYQRMGDSKNWDTYRTKIPPDLLDKWGEVMLECRRNGFIGPYTVANRILWHQVISTDNTTADLCYMCERPCQYRDDIDTGRTKYFKNQNHNQDGQETKRCWEK